MFRKTNYINQCDVALNYIKLHAIENVKVTEMNLIIEKNDRISVITIPKNAEMLIKILNNVKERQEQMN
ncbi:hypothetical protein CYV26_09065 [Carnobacterium maltaromaticum]|uniref:hypothetical protein n=1 Tax=Carnobacterium maltaromaticum TaxID=2751 RepID=UPI000C77C7EB|nr:hypothetical protein [Carnobacterium maltaromaticum]PLS34579.1 hypothetical protein CYV33_09055 [Carnobacterium maltaromaticum]PLS36398.1 hypothetical protein CYV30_06695 [Carnobacterium maltaromaticum]PLS37212.1 hypothetical protein CYV31_06695 [Carnobacterium maltaromaticum]PLS43428.1 hypothetical protein CYV28_06700 [Carnobacterium maltaromaticum]PLS43773.1 hypothetical protein CYV27_09055 [Carnobacterium maltaromaticum]